MSAAEVATARLPPASGQVPDRPLLIVAGLALGPVVALGLARFAYSLLLPAMRSDLHWSFAQAGAMNTANALGYLMGAITAGPLVARVRSRRPFLAGLALTALALLASAASANFEVLLALRLVAGATGAVVLIAGAGLVARLVVELDRGRSAVLLGAYFAGGGLGVVVSALIVPPVVGLGTDGSWRWGWVALGAASLVALVGATVAALKAPEPTVDAGHGILGWPVRRLAPILVAYALYGAGYIAYITFIVDFLKSKGLHAGTISVFWALLGTAAVVAGFAWGPLLGRLRGGRGPAAVLAVAAVGAVLPLVFRGEPGDFASAALFGGAFLSVVTAVINLARRSLSPGQVASAIATLTVAFAIGQSLGPILAGVLSDGPSGVAAGLDLSVGFMVAAMVVALTQRARSETPERAGTQVSKRGSKASR